MSLATADDHIVVEAMEAATQTEWCHRGTAYQRHAATAL